VGYDGVMVFMTFVRFNNATLRGTMQSAFDDFMAKVLLMKDTNNGGKLLLYFTVTVSVLIGKPFLPKPPLCLSINILLFPNTVLVVVFSVTHASTLFESSL
jgi:hypothetical protein